MSHTPFEVVLEYGDGRGLNDEVPPLLLGSIPECAEAHYANQPNSKNNHTSAVYVHMCISSI